MSSISPSQSKFHIVHIRVRRMSFSSSFTFRNNACQINYRPKHKRLKDDFLPLTRYDGYSSSLCVRQSRTRLCPSLERSLSSALLPLSPWCSTITSLILAFRPSPFRRFILIILRSIALAYRSNALTSRFLCMTSFFGILLVTMTVTGFRLGFIFVPARAGTTSTNSVG